MTDLTGYEHGSARPLGARRTRVGERRASAYEGRTPWETAKATAVAW